MHAHPLHGAHIERSEANNSEQGDLGETDDRSVCLDQTFQSNGRGVTEQWQSNGRAMTIQ